MCMCVKSSHVCFCASINKKPLFYEINLPMPMHSLLAIIPFLRKTNVSIYSTENYSMHWLQFH